MIDTDENIIQRYIDDLTQVLPKSVKFKICETDTFYTIYIDDDVFREFESHIDEILEKNLEFVAGDKFILIAPLSHEVSLDKEISLQSSQDFIEINNFLDELKSSNSLNFKKDILKKYSLNENIRIYLERVYDRTKYQYGIKKIPELIDCNKRRVTLNEVTDLLDKLNKRVYTGNDAIARVSRLLSECDENTRKAIINIFDRDIHCGVSTTLINKIFTNLIITYPYMRCSLIDKLKNITYPAILQLKADGTYRTFIKNNGEIKSYSRDGREYYHPSIIEQLKYFQDGVYIGEIVCNNLTGKNSTEIRYKSNGLLNSLTPPDDVTFYVWDYLTYEEFIKGQSNEPYYKRYENVRNNINSNLSNNEARIQEILTYRVNSYEEARKITESLINEGYEGTILKNENMIFKNGTSVYQIKLKHEQTIDVRCIGFTKGNGKFSNTFGAIEYKTDDDKIHGTVSGLTDTERSEISNNKSYYYDKILTIKATDLVKNKNSETYSLMHPRFEEFRNDKDETDDLERIKNMFKLI